MEALKEESDELAFGRSLESLQKMLDSQKELFHSQIDQLQNVVVTQCNLTGVNPLAQEMAAGALSIKIGKRPRDLLNPKAVKYMQAVFAIKDAISKKESREISALFGVTLAQVRDFFASQRTRVRKQVRLSQAIKSTATKERIDGINPVSDLVISLEPVPLNSVGPLTSEGEPSCSKQDASLVGLAEAETHFVENIFSTMQREETFSGQVKVMEWILAIQNPAVLHWFLAKGGTMILVTWLSEAATEQQTTVLLMILKVLVHLPLHKALPEYMSAILQSVNGLRFYRASDVSNRARMLLSRWSKLIARSQAVKKPNGVKSLAEAQNEMLLKQSISEIMGDESWQSNIENSEGVLALPNVRKPESPQPLKLLPSPADDSSRKQTLGVSSSIWWKRAPLASLDNRVRRKVQLVEHPGQKMPSKSSQTPKLIQGRPMSADDIQKAKMRAMYMQSKYGKAGSSSTGTNEIKIEGLKKPLIAQADVASCTGATKSLIAQADGASSLPMVCASPNAKEQKELATPSPVIIDKLETPVVAKPKMDPIETSMEKCKQVRIRWLKPPEFELSYIWRVGAGEHSKEIDAQKNRHRREKETIYRSILEIPSNPKEPWDREMDYDDSLTPEIPIEQQPDVDSSEIQVPETEHSEAVSVMSSSSQVGAGGTSGEPDLELLAVLLKNPELVFALTSGQAANISSEQTVKLLDMIKVGSMKDFGGKKEEKVQVSLPSPTPSSDPGTSGRRAEARNPFSHQTAIGNRVVSSTTLSTAVLPSPNFSMPHQQINGLSIPPQQLAAAAMAQSVHGLENRQLAYISDMSSNSPESHTSISLPVTRMQSHPQPIPQSNLVQIGSDKDTWRGRQQLPSNHYGHVNVNAHNISFSRPVQPQSGPTPHLERNRFVGGQGLRSWSPDDSLTMAQVYLPGQSGANLGSNHRSDRPWSGSSGLQDHNIQEKRGWYDRRG